jgi:hypothetical protein
MSDEPNPDILGSLPRTRPHRRSAKRTATKPAAASKPTATAAAKPKAAAAKPKTSVAKPKTAAAKPKTPAAEPKPAPTRRPATPGRTATPARRSEPPSGTELIGTVVQAAAELAEIGLSVSARAVRNAVARLPRP